MDKRIVLPLLLIMVFGSSGPLLLAEKYTPAGKRDPFISLIKMKKDQSAAIVEPPPLAERPPGLPGLLISEVTVTGTAGNQERKLVILKGVDDSSYIVGAQSKLYDGYIEQISDQEVVFTRQVTDSRGQTRVSKVVKHVKSEDR